MELVHGTVRHLVRDSGHPYQKDSHAQLHHRRYRRPRSEVPYGIAVNPDNGDFFVTDAKDYVTPGKLHCYDRQGKRKWSVTTGDIPAHIVFTRKQLRPLDE